MEESIKASLLPRLASSITELILDYYGIFRAKSEGVINLEQDITDIIPLDNSFVTCDKDGLVKVFNLLGDYIRIKPQEDIMSSILVPLSGNRFGILETCYTRGNYFIYVDMNSKTTVYRNIYGDRVYNLSDKKILIIGNTSHKTIIQLIHIEEDAKNSNCLLEGNISNDYEIFAKINENWFVVCMDDGRVCFCTINGSNKIVYRFINRYGSVGAANPVVVGESLIYSVENKDILYKYNFYSNCYTDSLSIKVTQIFPIGCRAILITRDGMSMWNMNNMSKEFEYDFVGSRMLMTPIIKGILPSDMIVSLWGDKLVISSPYCSKHIKIIDITHPDYCFIIGNNVGIMRTESSVELLY